MSATWMLRYVADQAALLSPTPCCGLRTALATHTAEQLGPIYVSLMLLMLQMTEELVWELFTQAGPVGELL